MESSNILIFRVAFLIPKPSGEKVTFKKKNARWCLNSAQSKTLLLFLFKHLPFFKKRKTTASNLNCRSYYSKIHRLFNTLE